MSIYSREIIEAAKRVALAFADGCDRCDGNDFDMLERAGLMDSGICKDASGSDTLEIGETVWTFNAAGRALLASLPA